MAISSDVGSPAKIIQAGGKVDRSMAWPVVLIVISVTVVVGILIGMDKDVGDLLTLVSVVIVPVLTAFGIGEIRKLKSNTNGVMTRTHEANERLVELLAKQLDSRPGSSKEE